MQRVAVARALLGHPDVLMADEPTSALDADHRSAFIRLLLKECYKRNTTVVLVSHDPVLASYVSRTILLEDIYDAAR
jgi:putative ABC transport system ATP-binding protein